MADQAKDFARGFLDSMLLEDTRDYMQRGRRLEAVATPELSKRWVAAFRAQVQAYCAFQLSSESSVRDRAIALARDFDDVNAEFRLRAIMPPVDDVTRELITLQKLALAAAPDWRPKLEKKLDEFLAEQRATSN
jgi:hypothetical protein